MVDLWNNVINFNLFLKKNFIEIIICSKCLIDLGFKIILFFIVVNR